MGVGWGLDDSAGRILLLGAMRGFSSVESHAEINRSARNEEQSQITFF